MIILTSDAQTREQLTKSGHRSEGRCSREHGHTGNSGAVALCGITTSVLFYKLLLLRGLSVPRLQEGTKENPSLQGLRGMNKLQILKREDSRQW